MVVSLLVLMYVFTILVFQCGGSTADSTACFTAAFTAGSTTVPVIVEPV